MLFFAPQGKEKRNIAKDRDWQQCNTATTHDLGIWSMWYVKLCQSSLVHRASAPQPRMAVKRLHSGHDSTDALARQVTDHPRAKANEHTNNPDDLLSLNSSKLAAA